MVTKNILMAIEGKDDTGFRQDMRLPLGTMESMVLWCSIERKEGKRYFRRIIFLDIPQASTTDYQRTLVAYSSR